MSEPSVAQCIDTVYASLQDDNRDLDEHIVALKAALAREGQAEAVFEAARLPQNNRQGRKFMQAYFRKRGVVVSFGAA